MPKKTRILVADVAAGSQTLKNLLGDSVLLISATTMSEALELLKSEFDLIVCGVHFDDSCMFDLLRTVKSDIRTRTTPFLCFRDLESELATTLLLSLEISCMAMGAVGFVDLYDLKRRHGLERADERFRQLLLGCLRRQQIK